MRRKKEEDTVKTTFLLPVVLTFVRAFNGETLFSETLEMDNASSVGSLFALVKRHPAAKGKSFCLKVRKQVYKDPVDAYVKLLGTEVMADAIDVNEDGDAALRIEVIFVPKQQTSSGWEEETG